MPGILSAGLYLPTPRLAGSTIAAAWGRPGGSGERTVADYDEDSLTMAAAAAARALAAVQAPGSAPAAAAPEALYFASTSAPLQDKCAAAIIAEALDLPEDVHSADFAGGGRGATSALLLALNAGRPALVAAGECRLAAPGSAMEPFFGDGAAAVMVGPGDGLARVIGTYSCTREFPDLWRAAGDRFVRSGDARYNAQAGYEAGVAQAVRAALRTWGLQPGEISQAWLGAPDARAAEGALRKLGLKGPAGAAATLARRAGLLGCAHPLALLAAGLDTARAGEKLLLVGYGDGVDVLLLEATGLAPDLSGVAEQALAGGRLLDHYNRYLRYRGMLPGQEQAGGFHSAIMMHREAPLYRRLVARQCPMCGFVLTLDLHTCPKCHYHGDFPPRKLARTGTVFASTREWYYPTPDPPVTMAVVDLDGGGRLTVQMVDAPAEVPAGLRVELCLRRLHDAGGIPHYYWKARPALSPVEGRRGC